jgi:tyrosyl-tRNA synthetase
MRIGKYLILDALKRLVEIGLAKSKSEAYRLIKQGAVSVDGRKLENHYLIYDESGAE